MADITILPEDGFIKIAALAAILQVSRTTVGRWAKKDADFPNSLKLSGGTTIFDAKEVRTWLQSREVTA